MEAMIQEILDIEWNMFDLVQNIGGRASCQDDLNTFIIQRGSQLQAWNNDIRQNYLRDLKSALQKGRNLLAEKYAYMMEHTSPAEYAAICNQLPVLSPVKKEIIARNVKTQVDWLCILSARYPFVTGNGRPIHANDDSLYSTSFETYLKGELSTYSTKTLQQYDNYVKELSAVGKNLNEIVLTYTCIAYGYASIEDAERKLSQRKAHQK